MPLAAFKPFKNYQANFCAECGVALEAEAVWAAWPWQARYFCYVCAAERRRARRLKPAAVLLVGAASALLAFNSSFTSHNTTGQRAPQPSAPTVSAQDATAQQRVALPASGRSATGEVRVLCGARTKKGTPCRHLVPPGQRCAQHRGRPSLLDAASAAAAIGHSAER